MSAGPASLRPLRCGPLPPCPPPPPASPAHHPPARPPPPAARTAVDEVTGRFSPPPRLAFKDGRVVAAANPSQEIPLKGLNFFGFNNEQAMIDGLWAGGTAAATDFNLIVHSVKLLGFNAVRLTFNMRIFEQYPSSKSQWCAAAGAGSSFDSPRPGARPGAGAGAAQAAGTGRPIAHSSCSAAAAGASPPAPTPLRGA